MELGFARGLLDGARRRPIPFRRIGLDDAEEGGRGPGAREEELGRTP
jgi:hypothetical protein